MESLRWEKATEIVTSSHHNLFGEAAQHNCGQLDDMAVPIS